MATDIVRRIRRSGLSIYDSLEQRTDLFIGHEALERTLQRALVGLNLDYPLRTRSKVLKSKVCEALGYPIPSSFRKTQPRFPGQNFDTYVQKADNLQIWNEEVSVSRRYVLIRVDERGKVVRVRVVTGEVIARLDTTGTLTHKFQARARAPINQSVLLSAVDTPNVVSKLLSTMPVWPGFLPIQDVFDRLTGLIGSTLRDPGRDQERNRGAALHNAVCRKLGKPSWRDDGQFPDVTDQLLEIKLQTAPTIDLGLVCPDGNEAIADYPEFHHRDVRYAVFYATLRKSAVRLDHLILTTGADFFTFFRRFEGKVKNAKLQIPLPGDFFR